MNKLLKTVLAAFSLIGLLACGTDDDQQSTDKVSPNISAGINTRASDTSWHAGDAIGLIMLQSNANTILDEKANSKYTTSQGDGLFTASGSDVIFFPGDGSTVDFLSYYPYTNTFTPFTTQVNVSDQTSLPQIDLLTSERFEGASKNKPNVLLRFHHRLTKLVFNFELEDPTTNAKVVSFYIAGMRTKTSYNMLSGQFTNDMSSGANIKVPVKQDSKENTTATAIVLPRAAGAGVVFHIKLDDEREYEVSLVNDLELKTETMYIFNILLRDKETPTSISAAIIEPWKNVDEIDIDSKPLIIEMEPDDTKDFKINENITIYDENGKLAVFTYDGNKYWTPETPVYWEKIGDGNSDKVTLWAEYVRKEAPDDCNQMPEVFIAKTEADRFGKVHFDFEIVPSKVRIALKSEGATGETFSSDDLKDATIRLTDFLINYDLTAGVYTPAQDIAANRGNVIMNGIEREAMVMPQKKSGPTAIIKIQGNEYVLNIPVEKELNLQAGKVCNLIVNVTLTKIPSFSASYTDWEEQAPIEGLTALILTGSGTTSNFVNGDTMALYYEKPDNKGIEKVEKFTYNGEQQWTSDPLYYWELLEDRAYHNFYAVSALNKAPESSNQMADIIYAEIKNSKKFDPIILQFTRQTAKVIVELESKDGSYSVNELKKAKIYLPGYTTGASFNMNQYVAGNTAKDVLLTYTETDLIWNGLIEEQTIESTSNLIKISIGSNDYYIKGTKMKYQKNKAYTFKVNIKKTGTSFTASYSDWESAGAPTDLVTELENK